eukprot:COSAG05_NODE_1201_length_5537_cov_9.015447_2_plen_39_part_00
MEKVPLTYKKKERKDNKSKRRIDRVLYMCIYVCVLLLL